MVDNKILMAKKYFGNTGIDGSDQYFQYLMKSLQATSYSL